MMMNYILLAITGIYTIATIAFLAMGKGWISNRPIRSILFMVVFGLVLFATIKGIDYNTFKIMIETGQFNF